VIQRINVTEYWRQEHISPKGSTIRAAAEFLESCGCRTALTLMNLRSFERDVDYCTLISTCFGFASSRFGRTISSKPSLNSATIFAGSMKLGKVKLRKNSP
jgi:hypothetical protein